MPDIVLDILARLAEQSPALAILMIAAARIEQQLVRCIDKNAAILDTVLKKVLEE